MVILADKNRKEIRHAKELEVDIEIGIENNFEMTSSVTEWTGDIDFGCCLYIPNTEYGGIVSEIESSTAQKQIYVRGDTWRGMLGRKIIEPKAGEDYRIVNGELNQVLREMLTECGLSQLFVVPFEDTEVQIQFQFERYCTLLSGLEKMLKSVGYRLDVSYIKKQSNACVMIQAEKITDFSGRKELSQDGKLIFTATDNQGGVNHLVCLGKGELKDQIVKHLYVQKDGSIGTIPYYVGLQERAETYDDSSTEESELTEKGTEHLREVMNAKKFTVDIGEEIETDMKIGDIVGGRDYITGIYVKKPIIAKIVNIKDGIYKTEYKIEGDD